MHICTFYTDAQMQLKQILGMFISFIVLYYFYVDIIHKILTVNEKKHFATPYYKNASFLSTCQLFVEIKIRYVPLDLINPYFTKVDSCF